jgi:signal peptidase I
MLPTLTMVTRVWVDKLDAETPRGRAIAFQCPEKPEQDFIKRMVGLPGETVVVKREEVFVNGRPIPRCRLGEWSYRAEGDDPATHTGELWLESVGATSWLVFLDSTSESHEYGTWLVAPGEVFVLGDNRDNSHDSRFWFGGKGGGVPKTAVRGKVRGADVPSLPKAAESLNAAFSGCVKTLTGQSF